MDLEFHELQSPSLRELFVKQMEGMILSGKLPVGTKLPTERELSEKMNVSRAVVNGGLADMEAKGFLQVIPRKGTYVADYKYKGKLDVLKSIMEYNDVDFEPEMLESLAQVRRDIEGTCFSLAALNRKDEDLDFLESCLLAMENTKDIEEHAELSFKFKHGLCIASGNMVYPLIYYSFKPIIVAFSAKYFTLSGKKGTEESIRLICLLFECIKNQDADKAKEVTLQLIGLGGNILGFK